MDYTYLILKFIIGGGVIVGVTLLADQVSPKYGGILVAAPIITSLAIFLTYSEAGQATSRQLVIGAFWFAIPSLLFLLTLYLLMARYPLIPSFSGALGVWLTAVVVINQILAAI